MEGEPSSEGIGAFIHSLPCSQSLIHVARARCHAGPTDDSEADPAFRKLTARQGRRRPGRFAREIQMKANAGTEERRDQRS